MYKNMFIYICVCLCVCLYMYINKFVPVPYVHTKVKCYICYTQEQGRIHFQLHGLKDFNILLNTLKRCT